METSQLQSAPRPASSKASPLKQHPVLPALPPNPVDATQTIFLKHPSARLSSSPASSPRIVDPSPKRRGSVHPAMSETMERGLVPGADFFDDGSSDSEWEDSEGDVTQMSPTSEGPGLRSLVHDANEKDASVGRGRSRERSTITALPSFPLPVHDSGLGIEYDEADGEQASSPLDSKGPKRARQMSLRRLNMNNVRLVQTRSSAGTPRDSLQSYDSDSASAIADLAKPFTFPDPRHSKDSPTALPQSSSLHKHHRRNTSDSMIADSIINAHVTTMRALESLNLSPTSSVSAPHGHTYLHSATTTTDVPKAASSLSTSRHVTLSPLSTAGSNRPAHLPGHYIKNSYLFTAKKEFPKPKSRPRQRGMHPGVHARQTEEYARLDSSRGDGEVQTPYDDRKGKHVLGLVTSAGDIDLRSRLERNQSAQGLARSRTDSGTESSESVVWVSVRKRTWGKSKAVDFDDKFFAERLRAAQRELAGSWARRMFSARKLDCIQLCQTNVWSGTTPPTTQSVNGCRSAASGLLAVGAGTDESRALFSESSLMGLYKRPATGKARYTW
ncbi:hypothetical protein BDW02DRAFT_468660, partial [Decorospora gaudefroyi]